METTNSRAIVAPINVNKLRQDYNLLILNLVGFDEVRLPNLEFIKWGEDGELLEAISTSKEFQSCKKRFVELVLSRCLEAQR
jgi:hypothetical protein